MNSFIIESSQEAKFKKYYTEIFPYKDLFNILKITNKKEISFCREGTSYIRYETFDTPDEFYRRICQINPFRIDVGANYKERPTKIANNIIESKELSFDVDLTDYDRSCCQDKKVCKKCYELIKCAVEMLNYILREEFGLNNVGFVFSGRRGVHCWVFGEDDLDGEIRSNIYKYFKNASTNIRKQHKDILLKYAKNDNEEELKRVFPILDKQVTVKMSHLIKMPFSIHPDTMNVSIPLDPEDIKEFDELPKVDAFINGDVKIDEYVNIMKKWIN